MPAVSTQRRLPTLLQALAGVPFKLYAVDVYAHPEVARRFAVFGIPHFLLFKGGKKLGKMSEALNYWQKSLALEENKKVAEKIENAKQKVTSGSPPLPAPPKRT